MPTQTRAATRIRLAATEEFDRLVAIENDAEAALVEAGVPLPADYPTMSHAALARSLAAGLLFVAVDDADHAIGFLAGRECDGALMVAELDVEHRLQGRGVGRVLMDHALAEGRRRGLWGAMLTTDRLAPFNRRFYATLGFVEDELATLPAALRGALADEVASGLHPARRLGMVLRFT